jgi:hypothetical protein
MVFPMKFEYLDFRAATYPKYDIVSLAMTSECPFNDFNIYSRWLCLYTIIIIAQIFLVEYCVEKKIYSTCMPLIHLCQTMYKLLP